MILSGDIGATKTDIGLFRLKNGALQSEGSIVFTSSSYSGLTEIIRAFLGKNMDQIRIACFGVAGPVIQNNVRTTNLPWKIAGDEVAQETGLSSVILINDLVATAEGIGSLPKGEVATLLAGEERAQGHCVLLAAGTGLGMALLARTPQGLLAIPSEGGHMDFAPRNEQEMDLFKFLRRRFGSHVSVERVVSGAGLRNIYDYLVETNFGTEDPDVMREIRCSDPARVVSEAALAGSSVRCTKALELFVSLYGAVAGNLALAGMAMGGVYLGGGIAPKILPKLTDGRFEEAFLDKGRFRSFLEKVPVRVILNAHTAMLGAAHYAARILATHPEGNLEQAASNDV